MNPSLISCIDDALDHARRVGADAVVERLVRARERVADAHPCGELSDDAAALWTGWRLARARYDRLAAARRAGGKGD